MHFYHHISGKKWAYVFYSNYFCDSVSSNKSNTEKKKNKLRKTSAFTLNILSIKAAGLHTMHTNYTTMWKPVPSHNATPLCLSWKIYVCLWLSLSGTWWRYWLRHRFKHTGRLGLMQSTGSWPVLRGRKSPIGLETKLGHRVCNTGALLSHFFSW